MNPGVPESLIVEARHCYQSCPVLLSDNHAHGDLPDTTLKVSLLANQYQSVILFRVTKAITM